MGGNQVAGHTAWVAARWQVTAWVAARWQVTQHGWQPDGRSRSMGGSQVAGHSMGGSQVAGHTAWVAAR